MLRIITAAIAGSVMIFVIYTLLSKKGWSAKMPGIGSGWKIPFVFLWANFLRPKKLIAWTLIIGAGYGIYLLVNYYTPPKSERLFKKIISNQIDVQTKDETANLEEMAESSGTSALSPNELKLAQKNRIDADKKRKNLEAMLKKPETKAAKPVTSKPNKEVWDWTFEWEATAKQMASGKQKIPGLINDTQFVSYDDKVLKFNYKRPSGKIVKMTLNRNKPETEYYFGRVSQSDLYLRVWLIPNQEEPGNFKGIADNGPNTISVEIFLKKKL